MDEAAKAVQATFDAAEKELRNAREAVVEAKEDCKRKMSLECDNCKNLKCKEAEENCKGHLDAAGKWISKNILAPVSAIAVNTFLSTFCYEIITAFWFVQIELALTPISPLTTKIYIMQEFPLQK